MTKPAALCDGDRLRIGTVEMTVRRYVRSRLDEVGATPVSGQHAPAAGRDLTGSRLGPYEIRGRLGAGGMGEVYRAQDSRLDREVALEGAAGRVLRK